MTSDEVLLGDLLLKDLHEQKAISHSQTATTVDDVGGVARIFEVRGPSWTVAVARYRWENGESDVRLFDRGNAPSIFDRLLHSLRMSEYECSEGLRARLEQARIGPGNVPRRAKADLTELDSGAGTAVAAALTAVGASGVGTAEDLFGDSGPARSWVWVTYPVSAAVAAVAGYTLSRLAPLQRGVTVSAP